VNTIRATPVSGGLTIGSANWIIETDDKKIVYMGGASRMADTLSGAERHPEAINLGPCLMNPDLLLLASLNPINNLPAPEDSLSRMCRHVGKTINRGGNVLIPTAPTGLVYDILETLIGYLSSIGLTSTPQYMISPSADQAIGYSSIAAEWLSKAKQEKAFVPESLFVHTDLLKAGHLKCFPSAHDPALATVYREPCIVYASHSSLRLGEASFFMNKFKGGGQNLVVLTEAGVPLEQLLEPFMPMQMQSLHCPIDLRLRVAEATQVIAKLEPTHVVTPREYLRCNPPIKAAPILSPQS